MSDDERLVYLARKLHFDSKRKTKATFKRVTFVYLILPSDFKVEEMSFSPVEASTPTKPGRDQVEIEVVILILLC